MKICPHCIKTVGRIFFLGFTMFLIGYVRSFCYTRKKSREIWFGIKRSICQSTNKLLSSFFVLVQSLSHVQLFATPWTVAHQASFTISWSLLKLMSVDSVMPSSHLILCCSRLLPIQSFPASGYFQMSQHFTSGGQSIGASASASVWLVKTE